MTIATTHLFANMQMQPISNRILLIVAITCLPWSQRADAQAIWDWKADGTANDCGGFSKNNQYWTQSEELCSPQMNVSTPSNWSTLKYPHKALAHLGHPVSAEINSAPEVIMPGWSGNIVLDDLTIGSNGSLLINERGIDVENLFENNGLIHGRTNNLGIRLLPNSGGHTNGGTIAADTVAPDNFRLGGLNGSIGVQLNNSGRLIASESNTLTLLNAAFINTGGSIESHDDSVVEIFGTASAPVLIQGGTLASSSNGRILIPQSFYALMENTITNEAKVAADGSVIATDDLTFLGDGHVTLGSRGVLAGEATIINSSLHTIDGVSGFGGISPAKLINNGNIKGNLSTSKIKLSGRVEGIGTMDNVWCLTDCTVAPGLSTASVNYGNVNYDGTLELEIGGTTPGSGFDQVNHVLGDGIAELGGFLEVNLLNQFRPSAADVFSIMNATSLSGEFLGLPNGSRVITARGEGSFIVTYDTPGGAVELSAFQPTFDADFDLDGDVDGNDFLILQRGLGLIGQFDNRNGDANGDGSVTSADIGVWNAQYGLPNAVANATNVPEPASCALFLITASLLLGSRCTTYLRRGSRR